jgi:glycyl-tRNA synthetase beta chain
VEVAAAAQEHYSPLGPSDDVPSAPVSVAVALADKIDTLTGFWAIDEKPTGSKDPFALRRAALGVIRLVLENGVRVGFKSRLNEQLLEVSAAVGYESPDNGIRYRKRILEEGLPITGDAKKEWLETSDEKSKDLLSFFHDRLKVYLRDKGISHDVIDACLAMPNNDDFTLLVKRAEALQGFVGSDDGTNLLQGFKRANNILSQAEAKDGVEYSYGADIKFAETDAERELFGALDTAEAAISPSMEAEDFGAAMTAMAGLRGPIDAFFEAVQVNADSETVRRNRLNLLSRIRTVMRQVADFTKVEG